MAVFNNMASLISIGPIIYFAETFGRKPVIALIFLGVAGDQLGIAFVHTPLWLEIIHGCSGIMVRLGLGLGFRV